ncbi:hypothetical protein AAMO2058_001602300 [Amorphochlora amoebiformis]
MPSRRGVWDVLVAFFALTMATTGANFSGKNMGVFAPLGRSPQVHRGPRGEIRRLAGIMGILRGGYGGALVQDAGQMRDYKDMRKSLESRLGKPLSPHWDLTLGYKNVESDRVDYETMHNQPSELEKREKRRVEKESSFCQRCFEKGDHWTYQCQKTEEEVETIRAEKAKYAQVLKKASKIREKEQNRKIFGAPLGSVPGSLKTSRKKSEKKENKKSAPPAPAQSSDPSTYTYTYTYTDTYTYTYSYSYSSTEEGEGKEGEEGGGRRRQKARGIRERRKSKENQPKTWALQSPSITPPKSLRVENEGAPWPRGH